jgi:hypothetical protein
MCDSAHVTSVPPASGGARGGDRRGPAGSFRPTRTGWTPAHARRGCLFHRRLTGNQDEASSLAMRAGGGFIKGPGERAAVVARPCATARPRREGSAKRRGGAPRVSAERFAKPVLPTISRARSPACVGAGLAGEADLSSDSSGSSPASRSADRMGRMIRDFLDFTHLGSSLRVQSEGGRLKRVVEGWNRAPRPHGALRRRHAGLGRVRTPIAWRRSSQPGRQRPSYNPPDARAHRLGSATRRA